MLHHDYWNKVWFSKDGHDDVAIDEGGDDDEIGVDKIFATFSFCFCCESECCSFSYNP